MLPASRSRGASTVFAVEALSLVAGRVNPLRTRYYAKTRAAEAIGLALHELATNAVKYGAISSPGGHDKQGKTGYCKNGGHVTISWAFEDHGIEPRRLLVNWIERGGPTVRPPSRKGVGHIVFERLVSKSLNGSVAIDFALDGLIWKLSIPTTHLVIEPVVIRHRSLLSGNRS